MADRVSAGRAAEAQGRGAGLAETPRTGRPRGRGARLISGVLEGREVEQGLRLEGRAVVGD